MDKDLPLFLSAGGIIAAVAISYGVVRAEVDELRDETKDLDELRQDMAILQSDVRNIAIQIIELRRIAEKRAQFEVDSYHLNREVLILQRELLKKLENLEDLKDGKPSK